MGSFEKMVEEIARAILIEDTINYDFVDKQWTGKVIHDDLVSECETSGVNMAPRDDDMKDVIAEFYVSSEPILEAGDAAAEMIMAVMFQAITREASDTMVGEGDEIIIAPDFHLKFWWDEAQEAMGVKARYTGRRSRVILPARG